MKIKTKRGARRIRNQRVVTRRFVVTDYTGCPYITAGKRYELRDPKQVERNDSTMFRITDDEGDTEYVRMYNDTLRIEGYFWQWATI